jgi:L-xylulokinase
MGEEKLLAAERGGSVYDIANKMAASVAPGESSIIFLPFLYGTNVDPDAKACFMGVSGWHKKEHLIRAVYEGIAFSHYSHIEKLLQYRDAPVSVRMAGGFTKSDVWLQMFADTLQLPVEVSEVSELGTLGAAMCAGVSAGAFSSLAGAAKVFAKISGTVAPDPAKKEIYEKKYNAYKKTAGILEPAWSVFD